MSTAGLPFARRQNGHSAVSVFDGGPDTWADASGGDLEIGQ